MAERALTAAGETIQAQRLAIDRLLQAQPQGNMLVDTRSLGKPPPFSGDLDAQGKPVDGMHWSQWSFAFRAYAGAFDPDARESAGASWTARSRSRPTSEVHSQLSTQLFYVLAMTCHVRALAVVQRVQEGYGGSRVWRHLCREFEPSPSSSLPGHVAGSASAAKSVDVSLPVTPSAGHVSPITSLSFQ